jgi:hypothetical protein
MKIRKFNESNSDKLDEEYLSFIFSEFIDNEAEVESEELKSQKYWHIFLEEPQLNLKFNSIDDYTKSTEEIYNFSKELESCFKRIDDDFPDAKYEIVIEEIRDEKGNYIFDRGIDRDFEFPMKLQRIIIITFNL